MVLSNLISPEWSHEVPINRRPESSKPLQEVRVSSDPNLTKKIVYLSLFLFALVNLARADTVILRNSDRLTGEIQKLANNRLSLRTSYAGIVNIDRRMIETVNSGRPYLIETENGLRMEGIISGNSEDIEIKTGNEIISLPFRSIKSIKLPANEEPKGTWSRVHGSLNFGYSISRGNSMTNQSSLGFSAEYRGNKQKTHVDAMSLFSTQDHSSTASRHFGSFRYDLFVTPRKFAFGLASLEHDGQQQLRLRANCPCQKFHLSKFQRIMDDALMTTCMPRVAEIYRTASKRKQ
jgi:Protein of unknown function, DUF481